MAQGDLTYDVNVSLILSTPQVQKLRVFLDSAIWDQELEEIKGISIDRRDSGEIHVTINGVRSDKPEDISFPVQVQSREE